MNKITEPIKRWRKKIAKLIRLNPLILAKYVCNLNMSKASSFLTTLQQSLIKETTPVSIWQNIFGNCSGSLVHNNKGLLFQNISLTVLSAVNNCSGYNPFVLHNAASPYCVTYNLICHQSARLYYDSLCAWQP